MCLGPEMLLPLVLGTALSAGGSMIKSGEEDKQAHDRANARNAVLDSILSKNDQIANDTRGIFNSNAQTYTPDAVQARQSDAENQRMADANAAITLPSDANPTTADSPDIVKSEVAKQLSGAVSQAKDKAKAMAKLGAFGDQWFRAGLGTSQASRDIGTQAGFASQNLQMLPALQDYAEAGSYKPVSPIGGILMGAGSALGSAGGSGYFTRKA